MKSFAGVAALVALAANTVSGHYIFQQFTASSTKYGVYQYSMRASQGRLSFALLPQAKSVTVVISRD